MSYIEWCWTVVTYVGATLAATVAVVFSLYLVALAVILAVDLTKRFQAGRKR